ncbi:MAG: hypothetical protein KDN22_11715 [Verrucomicrobiae bacterium]|nr:hypothetical protein [Verrucomicrobiae bacterium]
MLTQGHYATRLLSDGSIHGAFQANWADKRIEDLLINSMGDWMVASGGNGGCTVLRMNKDGTVDSSFHSPGIVSASCEGSLADAGNGQTYWLCEKAGNRKIMRLDRNGDIDPEFTYVTENTRDIGNLEIAVQRDGKVLVWEQGIADRDAAIRRLNRDGTIDEQFSPEAAASFRNRRIEIDRAGRILALARDGSLTRLLPDGSRDRQFLENTSYAGIEDIFLAGDAIYVTGRSLRSLDHLTEEETQLPSLVRMQGGDPLPGLPLVAAAPSDIRVPISNDVQFSVKAQGFPMELTYQWFKDDQSIPGETAPDLKLDHVNYDDQATYSIEVSNASGTTRASANLQVRGLRPGDVDNGIDFGSRFTGGDPLGVEPVPGGRTFMVHGNFTHLDGVHRPGLVRINADLSIDESFNAEIEDGVLARVLRVTTDGSVVTSLTSPGDGKMVMSMFHPDGSRFVYSIPGEFYYFNHLERSGIAQDGTLFAVGWHTGEHPGNQDDVSIIHIPPNSEPNDFEPVVFSLGNIGSWPGQRPSINGIKLLPDGKILVHGHWEFINGSPASAPLVILLPNGQLDQMLFTDSELYFSDVQIQSDGKMVLSSRDWTPSIRRYESDGTLDDSFELPPWNPSVEALYSLNVIADDRYFGVISGADPSAPEQLRLSQSVFFNPDGSIEKRYPWPAFIEMANHFPDQSFLSTLYLKGQDGTYHTEFSRRRGMGDDPVVFADPVLEAALREILKVPLERGLTAGDLMSFRALDLSNRGITDLRGLEGALDLEALIIDGNNITDLLPVSELYNLRILSAGGNEIRDASNIAMLPLLSHVALATNPLDPESRALLKGFMHRGVELAGNKEEPTASLEICNGVVGFFAHINANGEVSAESREGLTVSWPTEEGTGYRLQFSDDLLKWNPVSATMTGTGNLASVEVSEIGTGYYRLVVVD